MNSDWKILLELLKVILIIGFGGLVVWFFILQGAMETGFTARLLFSAVVIITLIIVFVRNGDSSGH